MNKEIEQQIIEAEKEKNITKLMKLTGFPADVIAGVRVMTRKERREWYRQNKKRLGLPAWNKLESLEKK